MKPVLVIIVNYRTPGLVTDCLHSLARDLGIAPGLRVIVVDNASGDGSVPQLRLLVTSQRWDDWVTVLALERNGGFAAGNNAALAHARMAAGVPQTVMFLNPDTTVKPGAIQTLARFLGEHPRAGIVGARVEGPDGRAQGSAFRAPTPWRELQRAARLGILDRICGQPTIPPSNPQSAPFRCDWVTGAAFCVRDVVLERVGPLDDGFFLYFDEVDFCRRAWRAGWEVWSNPRATIVHLEGASTAIRAPDSRRAPYWFHSRRRYFLKHHGVGGLLMADACWAVGRVSRRVREALRLASDRERLPAMFGRDLLLGDLAALLRGCRP